MSTDYTDALIVGAGPTGLTLACLLARSGVAVRLIDANPEPQRGSRGKGLQPRSLELFDDLGIVERVVARGVLGMPIRSHDEKGNVEIQDLQRRPPPRPDAPYLASLLTPQWRVEEALRARLAESGGAPEFGVELTGFTQDDEAVVADVASAGGPAKIRARWLVGCDGGRSVVRHAAGISFLGETLDMFRMLLGDFGVEGLDRDHWHTWRGPEGFLALCPLPSTDQFQLQASIAPGQDSETSLPVYQALVNRRAGRDDIVLSNPGWMSLWRANIRMVDRYRVGRVFLAGDAAHVHSPAGGQGMNTGIQDAFNLGWKLAATLGGADAALLDTYQQERLPVAASVLGLSTEIMNRAVAERGIVFRRDERTLQLGVGYRGSVLSMDLRPDGEGLRAGDRAPEASSGRTDLAAFSICCADRKSRCLASAPAGVP
jgi:2-polyprenyl-6-methoxyphenol hydroxylase-like FAD-dependent oxidoreductase